MLKYIVLSFFLTSLTFFGQTQIGENIEVTEPFFSLSTSSSISADGSRIIVGGGGKSNWGFRVYEYLEDEWVQIGNDVNTDFPNNTSVYRVSMSSNGNIVSVGAAVLDTNPEYGQVKIYQLIGSDWVQLGTTLFGDGDDDGFGSSLSLSANGNRLIVGERNGSNGRGHAKVFEYDGTDWNQIGSNIVGDVNQILFGFAVTISDDGQRVGITCNQFNVNNLTHVGLTRIFEYEGTTWNKLGNDIIGENNEEHFGADISLSNNGNRVIVGGSDFPNHNGFVRVFDYINSSWTQIGNTIYGDVVEGGFYKVTSSNDGNKIAIGASSVFFNGNRHGLVKLYQLHNMNWIQLGNDIIGEGLSDYFGSNLSISGDGSSIVIGAFKLNIQQSGSEEGYAKVFDISDLILLVGDFDLSKIAVYPNPTSNIIQFTNSKEIASITITDSFGRIISQYINSQNNIDVSYLQAGIYFIRLDINNNNSVVLKLIKK